MVFAILAFIGFEAAAPLGEEARHPSRTVPRTVVGSAILIGAFYCFAHMRGSSGGLRPLLGRPEFKTPDVAIIWMTIFALVLGVLLGWKWGPLTGFAMIATMAVPVVILVYMLVAASCVRYYLGSGRSQFNALLHVILPIGGIVLCFFPFDYQFSKVPPTYPVKYANWVAIAWTVLAVLLTIWIVKTRPERLEDMERVYVEDETVAPEARPAFLPAA